MHEFRRMMQPVLKNKWPAQWITLCLVLVSAGLLFSRALLSFASVLMIIPFLTATRKNFFENRYLLPVILILLPVWLSGLWSHDTNTWWNSVAIKLPLLTMLLGCSAVKLSQKQWLLTAMAFVILVSIGCSWSLYQYAANSDAIEASYLTAKVLPTLADQDYVRFSWMVMIAVLIGIKCLPGLPSKSTQALLLFLLASFIVYLHILATKTGLICLYSCCFIYLLHLVFIRKKWKMGLLILLMMSMAATIAYKSLPTLRNRVQYVVYDFSLFSKSDTGRGYNDAARWLSIRAGYAIMHSQPLTGVGFGDIRAAVNEWHNQFHPQSFDYERFLPANEWMVYGAGSGWPGMLCFTAGLLLLLLRSGSGSLVSLLLSVTAFIPMLTDDTIEGQLGVVLLSFIAFFGQQNFSQPEPGT